MCQPPERDRVAEGMTPSSDSGGGTGARLRELLRRKHVDAVFDWARFQVDTFPRDVTWLRRLGVPELESAGPYQELPWVGVHGGRRADSTRTRWEAMLPVVREQGVCTAVDIGANVGWFLFAFAELGILSVGVERVERNVRVGLYARRK